MAGVSEVHSSRLRPARREESDRRNGTGITKPEGPASAGFYFSEGNHSWSGVFSL